MKQENHESMTQTLISVGGASVTLPALFVPTPEAGKRFIEFFTANIRNANTRRAYTKATVEFAAWCEQVGLTDLRALEPMQVAAYIETLQRRLAAPSVKLHLAALRVLFDWLVVGQQLAVNPARSVKGPKHSTKKGKTPVLTAEEARGLLDTIDTTTVAGLRDHALISLMVYTFARVGAVLKMQVRDVFVQGRRTWVRLHEKGGKEHEMPCHHQLEASLHAYLEGAGLTTDDKGYLFRSLAGKTGQLTERPLGQSDVHRMIRRRAKAADIHTAIGCHTLPGHGDYRVFAQWREARSGPADGQS